MKLHINKNIWGKQILWGNCNIDKETNSTWISTTGLTVLFPITSPFSHIYQFYSMLFLMMTYSSQQHNLFLKASTDSTSAAVLILVKQKVKDLTCSLTSVKPWALTMSHKEPSHRAPPSWPDISTSLRLQSVYHPASNWAIVLKRTLLCTNEARVSEPSHKCDPWKRGTHQTHYHTC